MLGIEIYLAELKEHGYKVNNLFQLADGSWQMNVRKEVEGRELFYDFLIDATLDGLLQKYCKFVRDMPVGVEAYKYVEAPTPMRLNNITLADL